MLRAFSRDWENHPALIFIILFFIWMLILIFSVLNREMLEVKKLWFLVHSGCHNKMLHWKRGGCIWPWDVKVLTDLFGVWWGSTLWFLLITRFQVFCYSTRNGLWLPRVWGPWMREQCLLPLWCLWAAFVLGGHLVSFQPSWCKEQLSSLGTLL